jgi:hypothetical protein
MLRRGRINSSPTEEMIAETDRRPVKGRVVQHGKLRFDWPASSRLMRRNGGIAGQVTSLLSR